MENDSWRPATPNPVNLREVLIADPPLTLSTNLEDDEIPQACTILHQAGYFRGDQIPGLRIDTYWFDYLAGACFAIVLGDSITIVYRTYEQWDMHEAEKSREERERTERDQTVRRMRASYRQVIDDAVRRYDCGQVDKAEGILHLARSLQEEYRELQGESSAHKMLMFLYSQKDDPSDGLAYLDREYLEWDEYHAFAYRYGYRRPDAAFQVFEHALERFPNQHVLYKDYALLASGGPQRFDLAIDVCRRAIERGLHDYTKSGFAGRLKRIQAKQTRVTRDD